jgi:hypothetical protein
MKAVETLRTANNPDNLNRDIDDAKRGQVEGRFRKILMVSHVLHFTVLDSLLSILHILLYGVCLWSMSLQRLRSCACRSLDILADTVFVMF